MSEFVMVRRELLQNAANAVEYLALRADDIGESNAPIADELRAVLAQEAGHVEEPLGMVEPTAWLLDGSVGGSSLDFQITDLLETQNRHGGCLVPLFRVPPAPVAVVLAEYKVEDRDDNFPEGWNACLDKVKELNQ
jgi:hypothetical protein